MTVQPLPVTLDRVSRSKLAGQLRERRAGENTPVRWHEFVDRISETVSGVRAESSTLGQVLMGRARMLAWQITPEAVAASMKPGSLVYLCWGLPRRGGWRDAMFKFVLHRARAVIVNDATTRDEIRAMTGRKADLVPFFIDYNYFCFRPFSGRGEFLFCNGGNDRDPELLLALAKLGHKIVWLVNDPDLVARYSGQQENLSLCSNISYPKLRELYQTCTLSIMPASRDIHCAGQTTGMEAIACGAPVLISSGRTAKIFSCFPSVTALGGLSVEEWDCAVRTLLSRERRFALSEAAEVSSKVLARHAAPEAIIKKLAPSLGWHLKSLSSLEERHFFV